VTHGDTPSTPPRPQDTPLQRFGATLRQYRKQRRLSQQELAASTGIRRAYISDIELGKRNISVLTLLHITHVLRIPSSWLLAGLDTYADLALPVMGDPLPSRGVRDAMVTHDATLSLKPDDQATLLPLLGATIRQYRQQRGLFQAALATMTDLTPTYIGEIERGKRNLSVLSLLRIADALGLSVAHLLAPLETCQRSLPSLTR
jgi:transcriptional regulator with XRE-family HTH domain